MLVKNVPSSKLLYGQSRFCIILKGPKIFGMANEYGIDLKSPAALATEQSALKL